MNLRKALPWALLLAVLAFLAWKVHTSHFDWKALALSFRRADWRMLGAALLVIQINYVLRAMRWGVFLRRAGGGVSWWRLVGSQFVGFTGLAIFGRIGELIRPLLVARRTGLPFASQIAVVAVERVFDLGALGLLFGLSLAFSPGLRTLPHHELLQRVGYAIAALTVLVGVFVVGVRLAGAVVARMMGGFVGIVSKSAGAAFAEKILAFHEGLDVIGGWGDFGAAAGLSGLLWVAVAASYVLVMKGFPAPVGDLTVAHALVLLGFSAGGSVVQIPVVGGGAQAMSFAALTLFGIPQELAASTALMLWLVTTMGVIPIGLIFAKIEGVSIGKLARKSEQAEENPAALK